MSTVRITGTYNLTKPVLHRPDPPADPRTPQCCDCAADATWKIRAHRVNLTDLRRGDCGDFDWYGCDVHYRQWRRELDDIFRRLRRYVPVPCYSCGRPLGGSTDVLLTTRKI